MRVKHSVLSKEANTMSIGTTIKKLRRERDMTQEQLAEYLGITANAVSQWECDRTTPDISQFPLLVRIFNVSADELLEINLANKELEIEQLHDQIYELSQTGQQKEAFELARKAHKQYPDNYDLMYAYASHFCYIAQDTSYTAEEKEIFQTECIKLLEHIITECTEEYLRQNARSSLCFLYRDLGLFEKAEDIAEQFPILCNSREFIKAGLYGGNKGITETKTLLFVLIEHLSNRMIRNARTDEGSAFYSTEEMRALYEKQIAFLHLMFEKEDFGFFYSDLWEVHTFLSKSYAQEKHTEKTLYHLEEATNAMIRYIEDFYKKTFIHSSLLWKGYEESGEGIWYSSRENFATQLLNDTKKEVFDFLRENARFQAIIKQLQKYSRTWSV